MIIYGSDAEKAGLERECGLIGGEVSRLRSLYGFDAESGR
jgi:hypothetical protein